MIDLEKSLVLCRTYDERDAMFKAYRKEQAEILEIKAIQVRAENLDSELAYLAEKNKAVAVKAAAAVRAAAYIGTAFVLSAAILGLLT